jgi:hypothetical protein
VSVDVLDRDAARDRAVGVALALTASSMVGVTLAFARIALAARGTRPSVAWGLAVTMGWVIAVAPSPRRRQNARESTDVRERLASERERMPSAIPTGDGGPCSSANENAAATQPPGRVRALIVAALELTLLLTSYRHNSFLVSALLGWHALHAALAAVSRESSDLLARFTVASWFALALIVWGPA